MNQKKQISWAEVQAFDLDQPVSEYGFSVRLAYEQQWSVDFTERAILEYKKFMYLAAISKKMVSPSVLVDEVWHQHLIFTQSYKQFGEVLGKNIQHIPGTHHRTAEKDDFAASFEHTLALYKEHFGEYPKDIWHNKEFMQGVDTDTRDVGEKYGNILVNFFLLASVLGIFFGLYESIFSRRVENPDFLVFYSIGGVVLAGILYGHRRIFQAKFVQKLLDKHPFLQNLRPEELVYLKEQKTDAIAHLLVSELIDKQHISIDTENKMHLVSIPEKNERNAENMAVLSIFKGDAEGIYYPQVFKELKAQRIIEKTQNWAENFLEKVSNNPHFSFFFNIRLGLILGFLGLGFLRLVLGIIMGKSVGFLALALFFFCAFALVMLSDVHQKMISEELPYLYKRIISQKRAMPQQKYNWSYLLVGQSVFAASFIPLIGYVERNSGGSGDSSSGGSCGSSCGSSCGGGGGCGGCGGGGD